jgi:hypothetical protein
MNWNRSLTVADGLCFAGILAIIAGLIMINPAAIVLVAGASACYYGIRLHRLQEDEET